MVKTILIKQNHNKLAGRRQIHPAYSEWM